MRLALEAAGFHRHKRGEWRRRRMGDLTVGRADAPAADPPVPARVDELRDILTRAQAGDETALPRLRELFAADPARMLEVCRADLARVAEDVALDRMAGRNLLFREAVGRKLDSLRGELAGPGASPAERLLAERAALCWLDCHDWEIRHNQAMQSRDGLTFRQAEHYQKMRDRAHRRYLQALKALAAVKKLGPAIQINVARQQVNVAGPG